MSGGVSTGKLDDEKGVNIIEEDAEFVLPVVIRFFFAAFVTMKL